MNPFNKAPRDRNVYLVSDPMFYVYRDTFSYILTSFYKRFTKFLLILLIIYVHITRYLTLII